MSLAKLPLRLAAVQALRDRTWAGPAVFNSVIAPLATKVEDAAGLPFLVVYTDDSTASGVTLSARDHTAFRPTVDLVIHAAVATEFAGIAGGGQIRLAASDAALEAQLDILEAQILAVLQRAADPWCDLFRAFVQDRGEMRSRRGASARKGLRFAAREIVLPIGSVADPSGAGPEYPWSIATEVFAADPETADLAAVIADLSTGTATFADWRRSFAATGFDRATARALGFTTDAGEEIVFT